MTLGDRVAVMRGGVLQQVGTPMELYNHPNNLFVAGFIGSPAMNFLPATVEDGVVKLPMVDVPLPAGAREPLGRSRPQALIAGIRPEDFEDAAWSTARRGPGRHVQDEARRGRGDGLGVLRPLRRARAKQLKSAELEELQEDAGGEEETIGRQARVS